MDMTDALRIASRSDAGRVRERNEDCAGAAAELGLVVLADGMGGHRGGGTASAVAVATILSQVKAAVLGSGRSTLDDQLTEDSRENLILCEAVGKANAAVYQMAASDRAYHGMGTTLVAALFHGNRITIANVGDSRLYRFRDDRLEQITVDHSLRQELAARGVRAPELAGSVVNKSIVTRALGADASVAIDMHEESVAPNDLYLLCSDGLNDMLDDRDIARILNAASADLDRAAEALIAGANECGGRDNISVILVRIEPSRITTE